MERSMTVLPYDLHPKMATHIGQVKVMEKKLPSQVFVSNFIVIHHHESLDKHTYSGVSTSKFRAQAFNGMKSDCLVK